MIINFKGNIPSSKNSKQWTGKFLISSKTVQKYLKEHLHQWSDKTTIDKFKSSLEGKSKPYKLEFYFVRDSKRKFDYINACQLPLDLMVKYGWLDDDNADEVIPVFVGYEVDKKNAGLKIKIAE